MDDEFADLQALARAYGVLPSFWDISGQEQIASVEALRAVLGEFDCVVDGTTDLAALRRARKRAVAARCIEPVCVPRNGAVPISVPPGCSRLDCVLRTEEGGEQAWSVDVATLSRAPIDEVDGYAATVLTFPNPLPLGYHTLRIELGGEVHQSLVIQSPGRMWADSSNENRTRWGVFLPMYAVHGERSWGCGDFGEFRELLDWTAERGGDFVGTLPLLANEWEHGIDPSPYAPTSRRFWNEFHLDPRKCPEFERCTEARAFVESPAFRETMDRARGEQFVDYERLVPLKREVVEMLAKSFYAADNDRRGELQAWLREVPEADQFARYRARAEESGCRWPEWDVPPNGLEETVELDTQTYRYHTYAQWQTQVQLGDLARAESSLYLDFPLGVRRDGYDVWRDPTAFALSASGGAPPDSFFTKGQNWGFPPLHPEGIREVGYRPWIEGIRAHLRMAKLLRIDHAMGLHRLFWVPQGATARDGVYVQYHSEELFAILALESHRHEAVLVGENLGTCPPEVNEAMAEQALPGMYVVQFEIDAYNEDRTLNPVPTNTMASLNTHDLPTFHAFWNALDVDDHLDLGLLDEAEAGESREQRARMREAVTAFLVRQQFLPAMTDDEPAILGACLRWLAAQGPRYLLINLEDTWGEPLPQNMPGTWRERPNWRRRAGRSLQELRADDGLRALLESIAQAADRGT